MGDCEHAGTTPRRRIHRLTPWLLAATGALVLLTVFVVARYAGRLLTTEPTLLEWTDPRSGVTLRLVDTSSFDLDLRLDVRAGGVTHSSYVIDKSRYGMLALVECGDRYLLLNDQFIFAAFERLTQRVVPYEELPYTVYEGEGKVLVSKRVGQCAEMRSGFPVIKRPTTE